MKSEVRRLVLDTARRYPAQKLDKENIAALVDDWLVVAEESGFMRFEAGVHRTWQYCEFFPKTVNIRELMPPPRMADGERWNRELRELQARKLAGEKFYTMGDVLEEFANRIRSGKIRPRDPNWIEWAKHFKGSSAQAERLNEGSKR